MNCTKCMKKFSTVGNAKQHESKCRLDDRLPVKPLECETCNKTFKRKENLHYHLLQKKKCTQTSLKKECISCDTKFGRHAAWVVHQTSKKHLEMVCIETNLLT